MTFKIGAWFTGERLMGRFWGSKSQGAGGGGRRVRPDGDTPTQAGCPINCHTFSILVLQHNPFIFLCLSLLQTLNRWLL
jgi:hypothetical protein